MEFKIAFKINFELLQNSIAFSFKRKVKGKRTVRKKETKEDKIKIKSYRTYTEIITDLKLLFALIQNSTALSQLVYIVLFCFWDLGEFTNCLQKATAQSPWTTNDMATARNVGTAG